MKTKIFNIICAGLIVCGFTSCSDFLDEHIPQGTLSDEQVKDPALGFIDACP